MRVWPNKIRLGEFDVYYNVTRGMVGSDILEHGRPEEFNNNYTSGYGVEADPERRNFAS